MTSLKTIDPHLKIMFHTLTRSHTQATGAASNRTIPWHIHTHRGAYTTSGEAYAVSIFYYIIIQILAIFAACAREQVTVHQSMAFAANDQYAGPVRNVPTHKCE